MNVRYIFVIDITAVEHAHNGKTTLVVRISYFDVYKQIFAQSTVNLNMALVQSTSVITDMDCPCSITHNEDGYDETCLTESECLTSQDMKRRRKRMQWCSNCGRYGHSSKICQYPVLSCGVILFDRQLAAVDRSEGARNDPTSDSMGLDPHDIDYFQLSNTALKSQDAYNDAGNKVKYLLVRRKDSLNYVEFIRGKYDPNDVKFLYQAFTEISQAERLQIQTKPFADLWKGLWLNSSSVSHLTTSEFLHAENRFLQLKMGYRTIVGKYISLSSLLHETESKYDSPEWGFPKGKRNRRETDFECARREFYEETRIREDEYTVIHRLNSVSETFKGSNNVFYKHVYFVGRYLSQNPVTLNEADQEQLAEIGDIGWFTAEQALKMFRPYDVEKKMLLMRLDNVLSHIEFSEEDSRSSGQQVCTKDELNT